MSNFRLTLDVPYTFALEPEYLISKHCSEFRVKENSVQNVLRDETTGIIMLRPSAFGKEYFQDLRPLSDFRRSTDFWQQSQRSSDNSLLMSSVRPMSQAAELIEIQIAISLILIENATNDTLKWALESNFSLDVDEGFAIHYRAVTDELARKNNWFALQIDRYLFHFSQQGICRVYQYEDRNNLQQPPIIINEFRFAEPAELLNISGYFYFIPVPSVGLLLFHSFSKPSTSTFFSSTSVQISRSNLIPLPSYLDGNGTYHLWEASPIRVALNPFHQHILGFQHIKYPSAGTFVDDNIELPYKPSATPTLIPSPLNTIVQNISLAYKKTDGLTDWAIGTRQGRVKATLTTTSPKYTPFLFGYSLSFPAVLNTRNTTLLSISSKRQSGLTDSLMALEWTEEESGRLEAKAKLLIETEAGMRICERGDSTFTLEYQATNGNNWQFIMGGFAKKFHVEVKNDLNGYYYEVDVELLDMWERFKEWSLMNAARFDALSVGDALNLLLRANGFSPINPVPPDLLAKKLPPIRGGSAWRFQAREGDTGDEMARILLMLMRSQNAEWLLKWDWQAATWQAVEKPRDLQNYWQCVLSSNEPQSSNLPAVSEQNRVFRVSSLSFDPFPPEMNVLQCEGVTDPNPTPNSYRILTSPIVNYDSLNNINSVDYLGRMINQVARFSPISDEGELNRFARRIFDRSAHRSLQATVTSRDFMFSLRPNMLVKIKKLDNSQLLVDFWVKRKTVRVIWGGTETREGTFDVVYQLDSVWEGILK